MIDAEKYPCATCAHKGFDLLTYLFGNEDQQPCNRPGRRISPITGKPEETFLRLERMSGRPCGYEGYQHSARGKA